MFYFLTLRSVTDVIGIVRLFNGYIQNPFCTAKHFGLYPPCSALCEVKLWLGSLYFSWQNALQKWQMQQPALETQVSWGSWKWHCPEQFGGHTPAKIEDSVVKLQITKIGISQIGFALRNSVAFVWKKWVQIRNITVQNFTWNEIISFWTTNTILWSLKTGWSDKTLEICANRMCDLQKVTAGPTILPLSSSGFTSSVSHPHKGQQRFSHSACMKLLGSHCPWTSNNSMGANPASQNQGGFSSLPGTLFLF